MTYSDEFAGDAENFHKAVRFDCEAGYVGISQKTEEALWGDRVLLSPDQMRALVKFVAGQRLRRWVKDGQRAKAAR